MPGKQVTTTRFAVRVHCLACASTRLQRSPAGKTRHRTAEERRVGRRQTSAETVLKNNAGSVPGFQEDFRRQPQAVHRLLSPGLHSKSRLTRAARSARPIAGVKDVLRSRPPSQRTARTWSPHRDIGVKIGPQPVGPDSGDPAEKPARAGSTFTRTVNLTASTPG